MIVSRCATLDWKWKIQSCGRIIVSNREDLGRVDQVLDRILTDNDTSAE